MKEVQAVQKATEAALAATGIILENIKVYSKEIEMFMD